MTDKLPANLLALFAPRPPLRYLPHCDHAPDKRRTAPITGVAAFLEALHTPDPDYVPTESWMQKRDRLREEKKVAFEEKTKAALAKYTPDHDPQVRGDPFKTLFLSRLNYSVKESDLEREFGRFGPIERIRIVRDKETGKHRGYAFIVYEREKDMKAAYKETDGIRIKDRRVLVDVERGRTVKGWKPRRLGGGLGGRGYTKAPVTRPTGPSGYGGDGPRGPGGFGRGGGFRGGFQGGGYRGGRGGGGFSGGNRYDVGSGRGPRGGIGYQGGDRGPRGHENGHHSGAPPDAPTGPGGRRGGGGGGYGGGGSGGGYGGYGGDGGHRGGGDSGPRVNSSGGYDRHRGGHERGGGHEREGGSARDRFADPGRYSGHGRDDGRHDDGGYSRKRAYDSGDGYGGGDRHRRRY